MSKPPHDNPSSDIPSSFPSTSRKIRQKIRYNFYLQMKPLRKLRLAFQALVDIDGFYITVENDDNACARLSLNGSGMDIFVKPKSNIGHLVCLGPISESFPRLDRIGDVVRIFSVLGSNQLSFEFGDGPSSTEFLTTFIMSGTPFRGFPPFAPDCSIPVLTEDLREMIHYLRDTEDTKLVDAGIMRYSGKFEIGSREKWLYDYRDTEDGRIKGMDSSSIHMECINWTYDMFLIKASYLAPEFVMHFMPTPTGNVIFQFTMQDLGELAMMKQKVLTIENVGESDEDEDATESD